MNNEFFSKLSEIRQRIPEMIHRLPGIAKIEGLQFIHDNFAKEGFEQSPGQVNKWAPRKPVKGKKKNKRAGRQILIDKGHLRRSWDQETTASDSKVYFTSSLPYAEVHNEGLKAGRPPGFTMPQRQMIGDSEALNKRIEDKLDRMVDQIFK